MGVVYQGYDQRLRRNVCIKVFHQVSDSEDVRRTSYEHFVQEAFALSQLSHPHTLRIFDFGHLDDESGAPFQVSELLEGGTLARLVRRQGPRTPAETVALLTPVAGALSEAHARGIVHRDIKPSNIFLVVLGEERVPKLGDFGIALMPSGLVKPPGDASRSEMRLYSPGWAAPEQLRGERPAPATDVFALGLVTAFVLSGEPLFSTDDIAFNCERADTDGHVARRIEELELPGPFAEVVRTACRELPYERYDTAELFAAALRAAADACGTLPRTARVPVVESAREEPEPSGITSALLLAAHPSSEPAASAEGGSAPLAMRDLLRRALAQETVRLVISCEGPHRDSVGGRPLTRVPMTCDEVELGDAASPLSARALVRLTLMPSVGPLPRINIKGLNCFVARAGKRAAAAVDVASDAEVELLSPERKTLERVRCLLGQPSHEGKVYDIGGLTVVVTGGADEAVLLDVGPGRELFLIYRVSTAACLGGHS
jgi:serine/threonine protein kinase